MLNQVTLERVKLMLDRTPLGSGNFEISSDDDPLLQIDYLGDNTMSFLISKSSNYSVQCSPGEHLDTYEQAFGDLMSAMSRVEVWAMWVYENVRAHNNARKDEKVYESMDRVIYAHYKTEFDPLQHDDFEQIKSKFADLEERLEKQLEKQLITDAEVAELKAQLRSVLEQADGLNGRSFLRKAGRVFWNVSKWVANDPELRNRALDLVGDGIKLLKDANTVV